MQDIENTQIVKRLVGRQPGGYEPYGLDLDFFRRQSNGTAGSRALQNGFIRWEILELREILFTSATVLQQLLTEIEKQLAEAAGGMEGLRRSAIGSADMNGGKFEQGDPLDLGQIFEKLQVSHSLYLSARVSGTGFFGW